MPSRTEQAADAAIDLAMIPVAAYRAGRRRRLGFLPAWLRGHRHAGVGREAGDHDLIAILSRMVKQRQESARAYEEGGRLELAQKEEAEIGVIQEFLPRQLTEAETAAAIDTAIAALGADSLRDMGRVMAELRDRHAGQMDFGAVGPMVKARLLN